MYVSREELKEETIGNDRGNTRDWKTDENVSNIRSFTCIYYILTQA